jgi:hypothetical protein
MRNGTRFLQETTDVSSIKKGKGRTSSFAAGVSNSPKRARDWRGVKQPRRAAPGPERSGAPESPVAASRRCAQYKLDIRPIKKQKIEIFAEDKTVQTGA